MARRTHPSSNCPVTRGEVDLDRYAALDGAWQELGLAAPARRALVDAGLRRLEDLAKLSEERVRSLHGIGPNALAKLKVAMKKAGVAFHK
jgi:hypothetical protein